MLPSASSDSSRDKVVSEIFTTEIAYIGVLLQMAVCKAMLTTAIEEKSIKLSKVLIYQSVFIFDCLYLLVFNCVLCNSLYSIYVY